MPCHRFERYPCGKCGGCYAKRSSDWSVRLSHEKQSHQASSFVTLTYRDDSIVDVDKETPTLFLKRLRKRLAPDRIRYYLVSEYGEKGGRPHYHAIIFGHDFSQDPGAKLVRAGLFTSSLLEESWGLGHVSSGAVTDASIRYVSNYVLEKDEVPSYLDLETGHERSCAPTFALMSRNPGIGAQWIEQHSGETYRDDDVVVGGFRRQPPRYYDRRAFRDDDVKTTDLSGKTHVQNPSLEALRSLRRSAKLKLMNRSPETWLKNHDPLRRVAAAKIWRSKQSLKPKGDL